MSAVRTTSLRGLGLLAGLLLFVLAAPAASAQEPDPYGPTTTTTEPGGESGDPTCTLSPVTGEPGDLITATITNVFYGETVNINFDGQVVATKTAPEAPEVEGESVGAPVQFNGAALAAQALTTTLLIDFRIPTGATAGTHTITATGDTFTCFCGPNGVFRVLGASAGGTDNKPGGSSLARTGIYAGVLIALAVALLLAGRAAMKASKERRRRRQPTMAFHLEEDRQIVRPRR